MPDLPSVLADRHGVDARHRTVMAISQDSDGVLTSLRTLGEYFRLVGVTPYLYLSLSL